MSARGGFHCGQGGSGSLEEIRLQASSDRTFIKKKKREVVVEPFANPCSLLKHAVAVARHRIPGPESSDLWGPPSELLGQIAMAHVSHQLNTETQSTLPIDAPLASVARSLLSPST